MELSLEQLATMSCRDYGGNNCALHQCMFSCVLEDAKKRAREREKK